MPLLIVVGPEAPLDAVSVVMPMPSWTNAPTPFMALKRLRDRAVDDEECRRWQHCGPTAPVLPPLPACNVAPAAWVVPPGMLLLPVSVTLPGETATACHCPEPPLAPSVATLVTLLVKIRSSAKLNTSRRGFLNEVGVLVKTTLPTMAPLPG